MRTVSILFVWLLLVGGTVDAHAQFRMEKAQGEALFPETLGDLERTELNLGSGFAGRGHRVDPLGYIPTQQIRATYTHGSGADVTVHWYATHDGFDQLFEHADAAALALQSLVRTPEDLSTKTLDERTVYEGAVEEDLPALFYEDTDHPPSEHATLVVPLGGTAVVAWQAETEATSSEVLREATQALDFEAFDRAAKRYTESATESYLWDVLAVLPTNLLEAPRTSYYVDTSGFDAPLLRVNAFYDEAGNDNMGLSVGTHRDAALSFDEAFPYPLERGLASGAITEDTHDGYTTYAFVSADAERALIVTDEETGWVLLFGSDADTLEETAASIDLEALFDVFATFHRALWPPHGL